MFSNVCDIRIIVSNEMLAEASKTNFPDLRDIVLLSYVATAWYRNSKTAWFKPLDCISGAYAH